MQVCKEILNIGEQIELNNDELRLSEVIALFHDIGRFEQYAHYKTFVDRKSENHAELVCEQFRTIIVHHFLKKRLIHACFIQNCCAMQINWIFGG